MKRAIAILVGILWTSGISYSQSSRQEGFQAPDVSADSTQGRNIPRVGQKSPSMALEYSLFSTLVPIGAGLALISGDASTGDNPGTFLCAAGTFLGPSIGYFYAGNWKRGLSGIGIRLACTTLIGAGAAVAIGGVGGGGEGLGAGMALGGMGLVAFDAIYDIVKLPGTVRKQNERRTTLTILLFPFDYGTGPTIGCAFTFKFKS